MFSLSFLPMCAVIFFNTNMTSCDNGLLSAPIYVIVHGAIGSPDRSLSSVLVCVCARNTCSIVPLVLYPFTQDS
uniref:Putative secreted protein n=1 Tax=Amblyomma triste TaxID=251400 RepID=A0A023G2Y5_AMBTT